MIERAKLRTHTLALVQTHLRPGDYVFAFAHLGSGEFRKVPSIQTEQRVAPSYTAVWREKDAHGVKWLSNPLKPDQFVHSSVRTPDDQWLKALTSLATEGAKVAFSVSLQTTCVFLQGLKRNLQTQNPSETDIALKEVFDLRGFIGLKEVVSNKVLQVLSSLGFAAQARGLPRFSVSNDQAFESIVGEEMRKRFPLRSRDFGPFLTCLLADLHSFIAVGGKVTGEWGWLARSTDLHLSLNIYSTDTPPNHEPMTSLEV